MSDIATKEPSMPLKTDRPRYSPGGGCQPEQQDVGEAAPVGRIHANESVGQVYRPVGGRQQEETCVLFPKLGNGNSYASQMSARMGEEASSLGGTPVVLLDKEARQRGVEMHFRAEPQGLQGMSQHSVHSPHPGVRAAARDDVQQITHARNEQNCISIKSEQPDYHAHSSQASEPAGARTSSSSLSGKQREIGVFDARVERGRCQIVKVLDEQEESLGAGMAGCEQLEES